MMLSELGARPLKVDQMDEGKYLAAGPESQMEYKNGQSSMSMNDLPFWDSCPMAGDLHMWRCFAG